MIYEAEIWVDAPPQKVFDVIADVQRMFVFDPEVKSITITSQVKTGVGVTSHWIAERDGVMKEWDEEVTDYDPPRLFGFHIKSAARETRGRHELSPEKNGTRIHFTENHLRGGYDPKTSPQRMQAGLERIKGWAEQK